MSTSLVKLLPDKNMELSPDANGESSVKLFIEASRYSCFNIEFSQKIKKRVKWISKLQICYWIF